MKWPAQRTGTVPIISAHFRSLLAADTANYTVFPKPHPSMIFLYNSGRNEPILIIFGTRNRENISQ